jgi:bile acid:Na+ symporter, BASS family
MTQSSSPSTATPLHRSLLILALAALALYGYFGIIARESWAGWILMLSFISLAFAFRSYPSLKGYSYTVTIFAAVSLALYYPQYFSTWNGFKLSTLIKPLIMLIMFGMGTSMSLKDFTAVIKTPKGVILGVVSHFIIMPTLGFTLANISGLPLEVAAGLILIGCSPNGLASNVISYLAKANLALSVTITAISTLLAPFVTPFLMKLLAGAFVKIDPYKMMEEIFMMVIIPIAAGIIFNKLLHGRSKWVDKAMPLLSMFGIAFIITIITAAGRDNLISGALVLIPLVLIHNVFGYLLGYWSGRLFKMPERDCRTIAIEVGMQNGGLASALANQMGKAATMGLAPAVFGPLMNVTGSILASYWQKKPIKNADGTVLVIDEKELEASRH